MVDLRNREGLADRLKSAFGGPMSEAEVACLRDFQAFIDYGIRNGLSFQATMMYLAHDWNEFARFGYDFEAVMKQGFLPRVAGFSDSTSESVGSADSDD